MLSKALALVERMQMWVLKPKQNASKSLQIYYSDKLRIMYTLQCEATAGESEESFYLTEL